MSNIETFEHNLYIIHDAMNQVDTSILDEVDKKLVKRYFTCLFDIFQAYLLFEDGLDPDNEL